MLPGVSSVAAVIDAAGLSLKAALLRCCAVRLFAVRVFAVRVFAVRVFAVPVFAVSLFALAVLVFELACKAPSLDDCFARGHWQRALEKIKEMNEPFCSASSICLWQFAHSFLTV
ncbi:MAG: hypothetical protein IPP97_26425 [Candidatus Obscuribacter sp.]|nr:hypothetical protein [Candidatus Obscuribacter sp.]